jgi:DNA-binding MarR family transcriptional regulator
VDSGDNERLLGNLCWLLSQASFGLNSELAAALDDVGLSPRGHMVLIAAQDGGHSQAELAKLAGLDKTTMVTTVDDLERKGLARRVRHPADRRARIIEVTAQGRRALARADAVFDEIRRDVLSLIPAEQRAEFMANLQRLVSGRLGSASGTAQTARRRSPR